jgi:hypothetical protein
VLAGAAVLVAVTATDGVVGVSGATQATRAVQEPPANTAKVEKGKLSAMVSLDGTLTYRARSDGSPYSVINRARGTYTKLPDEGDKVDCGDVFYRVDDHPVLLLCGTVPAYRDLHRGDVGDDVRQLNRNLHALGYAVAAGVGIDPDDDGFTSNTEKALEVLQHDKGFDATGTLDLGDAVFLPESVRIAKVTGELGQGPTSADAATARAAVDAANRQLADAQSTVAAAQAMADKDGAAAQQGVANARQALADAHANLAAVQAQVDAGTAGDQVAIANARQALADAQRGLAAARAQREATSAADRTTVANAEKALDAARQVVAASPAVLKQQLEKAKDDLWAAQISRDATCGRDKGAGCASANATVAGLETAVNNFNATAAQAQKQNDQTVQQARNALDAATAAAGSDEAKLDAAVDQAQTQVNQAQAGLKAAEAALQNDQAKLRGSLTAAQTQANAAQSALNNAEAALASTQAKGEQAVVAARSQVNAAVSAQQTARANGSARPGAQVLYATSDTPEVRVDLDASQQGEVKEGDPAQITLPGNKSVTGKVDRLGRVAQIPAGQSASARQQVGAATIPAFIGLDDPVKARGLDKAPVRVDVTTEVVENALSVPVTALVGKSGGGFAVEAVRPDGRRELVAVRLGLFDTAGGRVQVEGDLREGDEVVVPSL